MRQFLTALLVFASLYAHAQSLYVKTYGSPKDKPLIFLHGGPGYNPVYFEVTTAPQLAANGFYVIVYDRRGEGRSLDTAARYTFEQTFADINGLYKTYHLKKAVLLGHSFGGVAATLYASKYPAAVDAVVLASAPVAAQETFRTILKTVKGIYTAKKDSTSLTYVSMIEGMDTSSLQYSSYCLGHAMLNGFYTVKEPSAEAKAIYKMAAADTLLKKYANQMTVQGPRGFWKNEKYTTLDLTPVIKNLVTKKVKVFGIYGKEDGLYSAQQVGELEALIGKDHVLYLDQSSHNVFADQQTLFIDGLKKWLK